MPEGLQSITQADFSAGAFPGYEDVPVNGVEDIQDGFLRDDGAIERRGGCSYFAGAVGSSGTAFYTLWNGFLGVGERTFAVWADGYLSVLNDDESTWTRISNNGGFTVARRQRWVTLAGLAITTNGPMIYAYGGVKTNTSTLTVTVTATNGSRTVTTASNFNTVVPGSGSTNGVKVGHVMEWSNSGQEPRYMAPVQTVNTDTTLTLATPWHGPTGTYAVEFSSIAAQDWVASASASFPDEVFVGVNASRSYAAVVADRLLIGYGSRVALSTAGQPGTIASDEYHELPLGANVIGLEPFRGAAYVFSTSGLFLITNVPYDLTDDLGNAQQALEQISPEFTLWDDNGIASHEGAVIAPAVDGVYLLAGSEFTRISDPIRPLYRSYVEAGYVPGIAAVYGEHYLLPILNGNTTVDMLVCNLRTRAWTRWAGQAGASVALARRVRSSGSDGLLAVPHGTTQTQVLDLGNCFTPSAAVKGDADGTAHQLKVTSRSITLSETIDHTLRFGRIRYELDDAASDNPTFTAEWSRGRPGSAFTALSGSAAEGDDTFTWSLAKAGQQTRMRFSSNNAAAKAIVRAMEFKVRQHGRT